MSMINRIPINYYNFGFFSLYRHTDLPTYILPNRYTHRLLSQNENVLE